MGPHHQSFTNEAGKHGQGTSVSGELGTHLIILERKQKLEAREGTQTGAPPSRNCLTLSVVVTALLLFVLRMEVVEKCRLSPMQTHLTEWVARTGNYTHRGTGELTDLAFIAAVAASCRLLRLLTEDLGRTYVWKCVAAEPMVQVQENLERGGISNTLRDEGPGEPGKKLNIHNALLSHSATDTTCE